MVFLCMCRVQLLLLRKDGRLCTYDTKKRDFVCEFVPPCVDYNQQVVPFAFCACKTGRVLLVAGTLIYIMAYLSCIYYLFLTPDVIVKQTTRLVDQMKAVPIKVRLGALWP
jgi:hypothetical protein